MTPKSGKGSAYFVIGSVVGAIVIGGAGYTAGAAGLGRNTVGTAQLKRDAVVSAKVENHSLRRADFANGELAPKAKVFAFNLAAGKRSSPFHSDGIVYTAVCSATPDGSTTALLYLGLLDGDSTANLKYTGNSGSSVGGVSTLNAVNGMNEFQATAVAGGGQTAAATFDGIVSTARVHTDLLVANANSADQFCSFRYSIAVSDR